MKLEEEEWEEIPGAMLECDLTRGKETVEGAREASGGAGGALTRLAQKSSMKFGSCAPGADIIACPGIKAEPA